MFKHPETFWRESLRSYIQERSPILSRRTSATHQAHREAHTVRGQRGTHTNHRGLRSPRCDVYKRAASYLWISRVVGDCYSSSQISEISPLSCNLHLAPSTHFSKQTPRNFDRRRMMTLVRGWGISHSAQS